MAEPLYVCHCEAYYQRMFNAPHRYDVPKVSTWDMLHAIERVIGLSLMPMQPWTVCGVLDVIRQIIPAPTIQDVKVATWLVGNDYEPDDIKEIVARVRHGHPFSPLERVKPGDWPEIVKILEGK